MLAELPEKVLLLTVNVPPLLSMPPPSPLLAELPEKILLLTVNVPPLSIPPPDVSVRPLES